MDAGSEFSIEVLPRGSILNAHNMLSKRSFTVNARCCQTTTYYTLSYDRVLEVAYKSPELARKFVREKGRSET